MYQEPVLFGRPNVTEDDALSVILREPRPNGFGGRLRFDDLEKLFCMLHVDPTEAERDDLWTEMIFLFNNGKPCAWIDDISLIVHSLSVSGLWESPPPPPTAPPVAPAAPSADTDSDSKLRYLWPTVCSARRTATSGGKLFHVAQPIPAAFSRPSTATVATLERLSKPKEQMNCKLPTSTAPDDSIAQCTFAPKVGRSASRRTTSTYQRETESYRNKHPQPADGAADALVEEDDEKGATSHGAPIAQASFFRPPPPLPDAVPIGYVDAVARLRRSATTHERRFRGFPESLRSPHGKKSAGQPSTILRLPGENEAINIWLLPSSER